MFVLVARLIVVHFIFQYLLKFSPIKILWKRLGTMISQFPTICMYLDVDNFCWFKFWVGLVGLLVGSLLCIIPDFKLIKI